MAIGIARIIIPNIRANARVDNRKPDLANANLTARLLQND
jgi:hypothetical protein